MINIRNISAVLLLAGPALAAPRWWSAYQGANVVKQVDEAPGAAASVSIPSQQIAAAQVAYTPPPGGFVSNGILYITTTIYLQPGESPPTATAAPHLSTPAVVAPSPQAPSSQALAPVASSPQPPVPQAPVSSPNAAPVSPVSSSAPTPAADSPVSTPVQEAPSSSSTPQAVSGSSSLTAAMIQAIAPQSSSCDGAPAAGECATAEQAAPALAASFSKYNIDSKGAQAAVIALEAFESAQFKYKQNHFPGIAGQGTRNMMMPTFVSEYATALYGASKVSSAGSPAAVLALVNGNDNDSFGSGAWFLSTKCPNVLSQFATAPDAAWSAYLGSGCIGTSDTSDRDALWTAAKKALSV